MDALLVHGFVREIEKLLKNDKIIPLDIYHICFDYYFTTTIIFYLHGVRGGDTMKPERDIACALNMDSDKRWKIDIHKLEDFESKITVKDAEDHESHIWSMDETGIAFTRNLELPKSIKSKISDLDIKFNNVIFRCGGKNNNYSSSDYCAALIFNSHEFQKPDNDKIIAYNWELPTLPRKMGPNFPVFSKSTNELLLVEDTNIFKLAFNDTVYLQQIDDSNKDWKWNKLDTEVPFSAMYGSAEMIQSTKLFVIGENDAEEAEAAILDMSKEKWIEVPSPNTNAIDRGIYYDDTKKLIYVGGGWNSSENCTSNRMEYYDINKNAWSELPQMNNGHDVNPLIWIDDGNLLHIMSVSGNCIEYIDLREAKKWEIKDKDVSKLFNTKFTDNDADATVSHLIGN